MTALMLLNPVNYLAYAALLSLLRPGRAIRWVALAMVTLFSPPFGVLGDRLLDLLARRRSLTLAHGRAGAS